MSLPVLVEPGNKRPHQGRNVLCFGWKINRLPGYRIIDSVLGFPVFSLQLSFNDALLDSGMDFLKEGFGYRLFRFGMAIDQIEAVVIIKDFPLVDLTGNHALTRQ